MRKVLIIEDDSVVAHIYETRLAKEGYQVEICTDGQSGFYRIHEFHPDAVLLDLMLPKMNGIEILKKIRAQAQFQRLPVIVFTNAYVPNMIHEAFQVGANNVFNKATLTPRQVMDALHQVIVFATENPSHGAAPPAGRSMTAGPDSAVSQGNSAAVVGEPSFHDSRPASGSPPAGPGGVPAGPATARAAMPAPTLDTEDDAEFQAELLRTFLDNSSETLSALRRAMQDFAKNQEESTRLPHLLELYRRVHSLTGSAGLAGLYSISQMAAGLEVLLKELHEKPKNINASTQRTVAQAIDFIAELLTRGTEVEKMEPGPNTILVVDDEILSRRAITYALEKAELKSVSVEDPQVALKLASENGFSLIFLDVQMPGMDGFELCTKIRALPNNKNTPIVFVTSLTDFKSRARSSLSGGNDLIAKPFMFIELSVKALTYVLRGRLANLQQAA
jgi:DNA-binding response OmpR family regulator/HPt (histidine-containing phosphotransfer) domain-containing protein